MGHIDRSAASDELYTIQLLVDSKHPTVRFNKEHHVSSGDTNKIQGFYYQTSSICHLYANFDVHFIVNSEQGDYKQIQHPIPPKFERSIYSAVLYICYILLCFSSHNGIGSFKLFKVIPADT